MIKARIRALTLTTTHPMLPSIIRRNDKSPYKGIDTVTCACEAGYGDVEMIKARIRALTRYKNPSTQNQGLMVEMIKARIRALTHTYQFGTSYSVNVEMIKARIRALTHFGSLFLVFTCTVEMIKARIRALTQ